MPLLIDTVNIAGIGFTKKVNNDQIVKKGDVLGMFDSTEIKKVGYDDTTMIFVTYTSNYESVNSTPGKVVKTGDAIINIK